MRIRSVLVVALAATILNTGCGEEQRPKSDVPLEKYEKFSLELIDAQNKGKFDAAGQEKLLKKHGLSKDQYEAAIAAYGQTDAIRARMQANLERMTKGLKQPTR